MSDYVLSELSVTADSQFNVHCAGSGVAGRTPDRPGSISRCADGQHDRPNQGPDKRDRDN